MKFSIKLLCCKISVPSLITIKQIAQLVQIGYLTFKFIRACVDALKKWNAKDPKEKPYIFIKKHMREMHYAIKRVSHTTKFYILSS